MYYRLIRIHWYRSVSTFLYLSCGSRCIIFYVCLEQQLYRLLYTCKSLAKNFSMVHMLYILYCTKTYNQTSFDIHNQTSFDIHNQTWFDIHNQTSFDIHNRTSFDIHNQTSFDIPNRTSFDIHN